MKARTQVWNVLRSALTIRNHWFVVGAVSASVLAAAAVSATVRMLILVSGAYAGPKRAAARATARAIAFVSRQMYAGSDSCSCRYGVLSQSGMCELDRNELPAGGGWSATPSGILIAYGKPYCDGRVRYQRYAPAGASKGAYHDASACAS